MRRGGLGVMRGMRRSGKRRRTDVKVPLDNVNDWRDVRRILMNKRRDRNSKGVVNLCMNWCDDNLPSIAEIKQAEDNDIALSELRREHVQLGGQYRQALAEVAAIGSRSCEWDEQKLCLVDGELTLIKVTIKGYFHGTAAGMSDVEDAHGMCRQIKWHWLRFTDREVEPSECWGCRGQSAGPLSGLCVECRDKARDKMQERGAG